MILDRIDSSSVLSCSPDLIAGVAMQAPGAIAIESQGKSLDYGDLEARDRHPAPLQHPQRAQVQPLEEDQPEDDRHCPKCGALEQRADQQHEPGDQYRDHDDVDQEAERLRLGAERVEH